MDPDSTNIRIGIVGLGEVGHQHADQVIDLNATLVGGVDINEDARNHFEDKYDVPTFKRFENFKENRIDAVIITTPNKFHEKYTISALQSGINVLLEKPLAHTLDSAENIAEVADSTDAFCMVGFNNRFRPAIEVFKEYQRGEKFGDLTHIDANYVRRRGIPGRGSWFTTQEISGGGALIDIGVHAVDLVLHFLDFPDIVEVSGKTRSEFGGREDYTYLQMYGEDSEGEFNVDDNTTAFLRTASGQTVSLEVAWAANRPPSNKFVIEGTEGGATIDRKKNDLTLYEVSSSKTSHFKDTKIKTNEENLYKREQRYFFNCIDSKNEIERNTVEQALEVQRVIEAIYQSDKEDKAIYLGTSQ